MEVVKEKEATPVSTGDWVITLLILAIPLVNIIMALVWAFGDGYKTSKSNFAKAYLIWLVIGIALGGVFMIAGVATFLSL